jgi:glucose-6-phosphate-specific signal transduction histidine kinase
MIEPMLTSLPRDRRDLAIALAMTCLGVVLMLEDLAADAGDPSVLIVPAFLLVTAPLAWRRTAPIAAVGAVLAALLLHVALFGTLTRCGVVFPAVFILAFAAASWLELRPALAALGLGVVVIVVVSLTDQEVDITVAPAIAILAGAMWGIGRVVRSRRALAETLESQTDELRGARDDRARMQVATERARLSTELDELLQRRLAALARLADGGAPHGDPAAAKAQLVAIELEGRRTLEEMRTVVGVLREDGVDAPTTPQPTLTHLEAMLLRAKGADARLTVEGSPRVLPAAVELSAYRIVEHLLAALDDAPGVEVCVHFGADALELTVTGATRRGSRAPIERATERARLHRGSLEAIVRDGRVEAVALLPLATA